jgi:hypothetical protein
MRCRWGWRRRGHLNCAALSCAAFTGQTGAGRSAERPTSPRDCSADSTLSTAPFGTTSAG